MFCLGKITLRDLKRCKLAHIFFDTFFNIEKYLDHEQRDPFMVAKVMTNVHILIMFGTNLYNYLCNNCSNHPFQDAESLGQEISDWERYAAEEYDILVAEEAANEQYNDG